METKEASLNLNDEFPIPLPIKDPVIVHYNPPDDEFNIWMYGVIFIGCAFILFVLGSVYLMCKSPARAEQATPIRTMTTIRQRPNGRVKGSL